MEFGVTDGHHECCCFQHGYGLACAAEPQFTSLSPGPFGEELSPVLAKFHCDGVFIAIGLGDAIVGDSYALGVFGGEVACEFSPQRTQPAAPRGCLCDGLVGSSPLGRRLGGSEVMG